MKLTYTTESLPGSLVKIIAQISKEDIASKKDKALKGFQDKVKIDGYRPGNVPADVLEKKIGAMGLWQECIEELIPDIYIETITKEKINAIGRPNINVTKLVANEDAEVTITVAVLPEITLPDYVKIAKEVAKEKEDLTVSDEELLEAIKMLQKMKVQENKTKLAGAEEAPKLSEIGDEELPELTDDFVKTLSPEFTSVEDFKTKLKENIGHEKAHRSEDKMRATMIEKIIEETVCEVPEVLVSYELDRMVAQFEYDIATNGLTMDKYLAHIGKTIEEVKAEMHPEAIKRAKMQLVLHKISDTEKIELDNEKVSKELEQLKITYAGHKDFNEDSARSYLETVMHNQAVIEKIEELGGIKKHTC